MGLGKQAKTLSNGQVDAVLGYLAKTRWPTRNRPIFLLSVKAGLRAKEIACLTWRMVTDARGQTGQAIHLEDTASKGGCRRKPSSTYSGDGTLTILALLLRGDTGLFQVGRCRLIGEHLNRPAEPLTQLTHALHLLAGRVDAAPSS
jgi:hypothetical protein